MANHWFRLWHDMANDPKWRTIAKISQQEISRVIAVFIHMMTCASNANERGRTHGWCDEDVASALDIKTSDVEAIRKAMQGRVLDGDYLTGWEIRQPLREDNSAERSKTWREKQKEKRTQSDADRTQTNTTELQDKDKDKEEKKEKKEKKKVEPVIEIPSWMPLDAWIGYLDMRREKNKSPTTRAVELLISHLTKFRAQGFDVAAILDCSTRNGYTDVYPPHAPQARASPKQESRQAGARSLVKPRQQVDIIDIIENAKQLPEPH